MKRGIITSFVAVILIVLLGCSALRQSGEVVPEEIAIQHPNLFPEGIEYDPTRDQFLVGSVTQGAVFIVHDDGTTEPLTNDPELKTSFGLEVDESRDRLLVAANSNPAACGGDFSGVAPAFLGIYNLATGNRLHWIDLAAVNPGEPNYANDLIPIRQDVIIYGKDYVGMGWKHVRKTSRDIVGRTGYPRVATGMVPETRGR